MTRNKSFGSSTVASNMSTWEKNDIGQFAGNKDLVDPAALPLGLLPITGLVVSFVLYVMSRPMTGHTGRKQQVKRTAHVVGLAQCCYLIGFLLFVA